MARANGTMVSSSVILVAGLAMLGSSTTSAFTTFASPHSTSGAAVRSSPSCDGTARRHSSTAAVGVVAGSRRRTASPLRMSTAEEAPAAAEVAVQDETSGSGAQQPTRDIPTTLPSDCGIDYVPLATMLATGDLKGADQFTRDALIKAAGAGSQKREFVYWTEVKNIPK